MGKLKRSRKNSDLRGGFTTGACAAAAARAAVYKLVSEQQTSEIEITLPNGENAKFELARLEGTDEVTAGVVKDAGDDPDCTHGLEIQCIARRTSKKGIHIIGGKGVATVTLPGLELAVGEPAINPVPRKNIIQMATIEWLKISEARREEVGLELEICVPDGEKAAKETINERLGLMGGISILGTRGTVKPFSTSAFAASVRQSIEIAKANGCKHVVLTTGSRTEKAAMGLLPELSDLAFIQAGDFIGVGLRGAKRYDVKRVTVVAMIGKLAKLVSGRMMTHVSGHAIDFQQLSELASEENIPEAVCEDIVTANTGRHVLDQVRRYESQPYLTRLCREANEHANQYTANALDLQVLLVDFDGSLLASFPSYNPNNNQKQAEQKWTK